MSRLASELNVPEILGEDGIIGEQIADFKPRDSQLGMASLIETAIGNSESHIIEASTGIGKSFAYLVPVFLSDSKAVISTGTKNLQDQLFYKDIPLIRNTLVSAKKVALLKGRSNYCCWYRVNKFREQKFFRNRDTAALFSHLGDWAAHSESGDISEFPGIPENDRLWYYATSNADNCLGGECPDYDRCFVVKARKQAMDADIVVVNHHLYFSDQALKQDGFGEILPDTEVLVFDEAHQLPDIASHFFGIRLSLRQIETLSKDTLEAEVAEAPDSKALASPSRQLDKAALDFRLALEGFAQKLEWSRIQYAPAIRQAVEQLKAAIDDLLETLEAVAVRGKELASCFRRLESLQQDFQQFLQPADNQVSWYEWSERNFHLNISPLEVSEAFRQKLETSGCDSVFFTSATLSSQQSFHYFGHRLGIEDIETNRFDSPFDYAKQALLFLPQSLPDPSQSDYARAFGELCRELIEITRGHCFILFTSYRMLGLTADYLRSRIDYPLFVQGDYQRNELLQRFVQGKHSVLLGTSSFWEGVDVKGDQLRCVIIDKLPFKSPGDPVYGKRLQLANAQGGNAFVDIQIPEATISLRQGVGRLIRDVEDRGIVAICDNRLNSKSYGATMIDSLPAMRRSHDLDEVKQFARDNFQP